MVNKSKSTEVRATTSITPTKIFISWSGGKDCMFALYRILQDQNYQVTHLLNMCEPETGRSQSHRMPSYLIAEQAKLLGIEILQPVCNYKNYESTFKSSIETLKKTGVGGGVFGDIYLKEHRHWIERVCAETGIVPIFPLWKNDTVQLLNDIVNLGFRALVVSVNKNFLPSSWLGREITSEFISDIRLIPGIDPCAENGEYHSFVFDGPIFKQLLPFQRRQAYFYDQHWFLTLQ